MLFNDVVETHCYVTARRLWLQHPTTDTTMLCPPKCVVDWLGVLGLCVQCVPVWCWHFWDPGLEEESSRGVGTGVNHTSFSPINGMTSRVSMFY